MDISKFGVNSISFLGVKKILIVEDQDDWRRLEKTVIRRALKPEDTAEVTEADTFQKGKDFLEKDSYDLVITDGNISTDNDGLDIAHFASKKAEKPKVVMVSGDIRLRSRLQGLGAEFVSKFDIVKKLPGTIKSLLYGE